MTDEQLQKLKIMNADARSDLVCRALEELVPRYDARKLLTLIWRHCDGMSVDEIGARLKVGKGTISKWCKHAEQELAAAIEQILSGSKEQGSAG